MARVEAARVLGQIHETPAYGIADLHGRSVALDRPRPTDEAVIDTAERALALSDLVSDRVAFDEAAAIAAWYTPRRIVVGVPHPSIRGTYGSWRIHRIRRGIDAWQR